MNFDRLSEYVSEPPVTAEVNWFVASLEMVEPWDTDCIAMIQAAYDSGGESGVERLLEDHFPRLGEKVRTQLEHLRHSQSVGEAEHEHQLAAREIADGVIGRAMAAFVIQPRQ